MLTRPVAVRPERAGAVGRHRADPDEDEHREQLKRETSEDEGQHDQRLPGARQAEPAPMLRGRRGNVRRRRWRIGYRQRLHRGTRRLRKPRFQQRHWPLDEAEHQPLGSKSADEHQRQLPGDIEQLMIGGWIVGGPHEPVIERPEMRQCPHDVGDLARNLADLLGHRKQELCAKAVRSERYRGFRFGRRALRRLRCIGDRAQRLDDLRALLVVGKGLERPLRLIGRKHVSFVGGRGGRRSVGLSESRNNKQGAGEENRRQEFERHEDLFGKNAPDGETGIGLALVRTSCRIACFRRHPVSEVCRSDGFLLAFRLALQHHRNAAALNRRELCNH